MKLAISSLNYLEMPNYFTINLFYISYSLGFAMIIYEDIIKRIITPLKE